MRVELILGLMLFAVVGCGSASGPETGEEPVEGGESNGVEGSGSGSDVSENAMAVLTIDGETFTFEANEWSRCQIGDQPTDVEAYFGDGEEVVAGVSDYDYVSFNIVLDKLFIRGRTGGDERTHTTGTDAMELETRSDGFSYSHENGQPVRLDITC